MFTTNDDLTKIANSIGTDKGTENFEGHGYTAIYNSLFYLWRENSIKMLEIGVYDPRFPGASVKMWSEYFPYLKFVGFDINPDAKTLEKDNVEIRIGDASNTDELLQCGFDYYQDYDIIIDDGSHRSEHILNAFHTLFQFVKPGGYYIIEDLHTPQSKRRETIQDLAFIMESEKFKIEEKRLECNGKLLVIKKGS